MRAEESRGVDGVSEGLRICGNIEQEGRLINLYRETEKLNFFPHSFRRWQRIYLYMFETFLTIIVSAILRLLLLLDG